MGNARDLQSDATARMNAAMQNGNFLEAMLADSERLFAAAIEVFMEEGFRLFVEGLPGEDYESPQPMNGELLRATAEGARAHVDAQLKSGSPVSVRLRMATDLTGLILSQFEQASLPEDQHDVCLFAMTNRGIGSLSAILWHERAGLYSDALAHHDRKKKDLLAQRKATESRIAWQVPALAYARGECERSPTTSSRQLARQIRTKFRAELESLPEVERITEVVSAWRSKGELPPRVTKS
jgi:hypothetical protein